MTRASLVPRWGRVRVLAAVLTVAAAAGVVWLAAGGAQRGGPDRPNVLLLVMDTTRADHCSVSGGPLPTTPALDELAATGTRWLNAWSPAGWTAPAHASLFTGLRPDRHRIDVGSAMYLDPSIPTLAETLGSAGWATACFTNNSWISPALGLSRGFGTYVPMYEVEDRPYPWCTETHARALEWALGERREGRPFFLFVNDMEPHLPYMPPEEFARPFLPEDATPDEVERARRFDVPDAIRAIALDKLPDERTLRILRALYCGEIAALDASIGDLLRGLDAAGALDETLVVVCADHGENIGDHGLLDHRFSLHRSIRHVPLVMRLPGAFDSGEAVRDVVRLEDVFPTVLEACGIEVPPGLDGASLAAPEAGRPSLASTGDPSSLLSSMRERFPEGDVSRFAVTREAATDGRWHYLRTSAGEEEIYDVREDPGETKDLSRRRPPEMGALRRLLDAR